MDTDILGLPQEDQKWSPFPFQDGLEQDSEKAQQVVKIFLNIKKPRDMCEGFFKLKKILCL